MAIKMSTLDGKEFAIGRSKPRDNASKGHKLAIQMIKDELPSAVILEEVSIRVTTRDKSRQYLDIYLPKRDLVIEVHGRQHKEFVLHFHGSKKEFRKAQLKDRQKKEWCELNELRLIELFHDESEDEWRDKIKRAIRG